MSANRFRLSSNMLFIHLNFTMKNLRFWSLYLPWEDDLHSIDILEVECVEHHKVAWDQDPDQEKKYDGFVFKDGQGRPWHNQYPRASYGQLDDSQNWTVRPGWEDLADDEARMSYTDLGIFLDRVWRGIADFDEGGDACAPKKHASMLEFFNKILEKVLALGYNVLVEKNTSVRYHLDRDSGAVAAQINNRPMYKVEVYKLNPTNKKEG